jgi:hypothetical protein
MVQLRWRNTSTNLLFFGAEEFLEKYKDSDKDSAKDSGIWSFWSWFLFCLYGCFNSRDYY